MKFEIIGDNLQMIKMDLAPAGVPGFVSFASTMPGKIFSISIDDSHVFIARRDSFLCCEEGVQLDIAFAENIRTGLFGGGGSSCRGW